MGDAANDRLYGDAYAMYDNAVGGADCLNGGSGSGNDTMDGGGGRDLFAFDLSSGRDTIQFRPGEDQIDPRAWRFASFDNLSIADRTGYSVI
jgi:hypothetical protein